MIAKHPGYGLRWNRSVAITETPLFSQVNDWHKFIQNVLREAAILILSQVIFHSKITSDSPISLDLPHLVCILAVLNHSWAVTIGRFPGRRFWTWTLTLTSQMLIVIFGADAENACKTPSWKFRWRYLRDGSSDSLHVWFQGGVFGIGGSNGAISSWTKFSKYVGENNARGVIRLITI